MAIKMYTEEYIQAIANAIREKNGLTDLYTVTEMPDAIRNIGDLPFNPIGDGFTHLYITLTANTLDITLIFKCPTYTTGLIEWGDGTTTTETGSGSGPHTLQHSYAEPGDYVITISSNNGENGPLSLGYGQSSRLINSGYGEYNTILTAAEITHPVNSYCFTNCTELKDVVIYPGCTSLGSYAFNDCTKLKSVVFNTAPELNTYVFNYCTNLKEITIPDGVTTLPGNLFTYCSNLETVNLPDSLETIGNSFSQCYSLQEITIPENVTSIGNVFNYCYSMHEIHMQPTTPPTVSGLNITASDYKIYVPAGTLADYQTAWSSYASYMVEE